MICNLCPRECGVDRAVTRGFCGMNETMTVARIAPHFDEEPLISGTNGVGAIFFSGCTLRCRYCQNFEISTELKGRAITPAELSDAIRQLEASGVHAIELVTPTHFLPQILKALSSYRPKTPLIYNTSGYEKVETLRMLDGLIDVYLPDFKYSDNRLANRLSACSDYVETTLAAIGEMLRQVGDVTIADGLIKKGVIIRHLVLPNHVKNSLGALDLIREHFGDRAMVSLMSQYLPCGRAEELEDLNRRITRREYQKALDHLYDLNLDGFAQEQTSAKKDYIPDWNLDNA